MTPSCVDDRMAAPNWNTTARECPGLLGIQHST
jgi:hypothetical protein